MICERVESAIDVHVQSRIDKRASVTVDVVVVPFAFDVRRYLLHICLPIDLGILKSQYYSLI